MQIEDITSALNKYLEDKRNLERIDIKEHFVVKRNTANKNPPHRPLYSTNRYYVTPVQDKEIFTIMNTDKCPSGSEGAYWENLSKEYLLYVFNLMRTDTFTKLIYGKPDREHWISNSYN